MFKLTCLLASWAPVLLLSTAGSALAAVPRYGVTLIDPVPGATVTALNNAGVAVGARYDEALGARGAYSWSAGQFTMLPWEMERATAISNAGHIVGTSPVLEEGGGMQMMSSGVIYHQGATRGVAQAFTPDYSTGYWSNFTTPVGVNSAGTVLTRQETNAGGGIYLANGDSVTVLPFRHGAAINESGQVAGSKLDENGGFSHAVLYDNGLVVDLGTLAGGRDSYASDLNDSGVVVGGSDFGTVGLSDRQSFIWRDGVMEAIGSTATRNTARAINNHGDVVGIFATGGTGLDQTHSYLYKDGVQYDLATLLAGGGGWRITEVVDINDSGHIAGQACNAGGMCYAALLTPVPEPATWGMLLAGLGLLAWRGTTKAGALPRA